METEIYRSDIRISIKMEHMSMTDSIAGNSNFGKFLEILRILTAVGLRKLMRPWRNSQSNQWLLNVLVFGVPFSTGNGRASAFL